MELGLQQKLALKQKLSPHLLQSISYLTYSLDELNSELQKQLTENPVLEDDLLKENISERKSDNSPNDDKLRQIEEKNDFDDEDWKQVFESNGKTFEGYKTRNPEYDELYDPDRKGFLNITLQDHLLEQAKIHMGTGLDLKIAELIIENINDDGILEEIINIYSDEIENNERKLLDKKNIFDYIVEKINNEYEDEVITKEDVADVLNMINHFDPVGCGALSKLEAIYIQAQHNNYPEYVKEIIKNDLGLLEANNIKKIKEKYSINNEEIKKIQLLISQLEPIPGRKFGNNNPEYIKPEIKVIKEEGNYKVELINEAFKKVYLSNKYLKLYEESKSPEDKAYFEEKIKKARELIKSVNERKKTIVRVMEEIIEIQKEYFDNNGDNSYLKALTLKDIASKLDLDESTISRATKYKYVQTPFGLFELKHFFSTPVKGIGTADQSMTKVKSIIKKLIDNEDKKKPLTDAKISEILKNEYSLKVGRKTVCNYRISLEIPSTSRRKKIL